MEIPDKAETSQFENRRIDVRIDSDDALGCSHSGQMLNGARDPAGDIEVRRDHLTGLPHLVGVGDVAGVDRCPACSYGGSQDLC